MSPDNAAWDGAVQAAALFAVDPAGLGGVVLAGPAGFVRERWLEHLARLMPAGTPLRSLPPQVGDERLLGGLDLGATLRGGRPVAQRGLLAECDGGVLRVAMAERLDASVAARICAVLDSGVVQVARDGIVRSDASRFGIVALDEAVDADETMSAALADRLAFRLELRGVAWRVAQRSLPVDPQQILRARERLAGVPATDDVVEALCAAAAALGIASSRAPWLALRAACAAAALDGCGEILQSHAELAARLVLGPRAATWPAPPPDAAGDAPPEPQSAPDDAGAGQEPHDDAAPESGSGVVEEQVVAAARAAIPAGLLARLQGGDARRRGAASAGKSGAQRQGGLRGRPAGVRRGPPRRGARLNLIETLRAAAPWQGLRRAEASIGAAVCVRPEDFRVTRFRQRTRTTTVFAIDASGSSALHRLAEAKGAVELLLADCYVRRDQVAVIAFRGAGAELLLPPTRSLVRAKRSLAGLPGGGGTPLASGLDAALLLADSARRRGDTPLLVLLTDGRANIARDGTPERARAEQDALAAAARWRAAGLPALLVDTAPRPEPRARALAERMQARYLPLPQAQAAQLSKAVQAAAADLAAH